MRTTNLLQRFIQASALGLALFIGAGAQAQFGEAAGIAEAMQPDYYRRDIVLFQQGLNLDDSQRDIMDALYSDYEQAFESGLANMRKKIEDMREQLQNTDVDQVLRIVFKPIEDWSNEKRGIGAQFLESVKVVLTPEQMEQWPKFERFLFREKHLPTGTLSGESLNLFNIVRDMKLSGPETERMQPTLDEYDVTLDVALKARHDALTSNQSEMLRSFAEQNSAVSLAILQRQIGKSIAVRDVNDQYTLLLSTVMPDGLQSEFLAKALERAYPRIFRPTPVQSIFKSAKELEGLSADTHAAIIELEGQYLSELKAINEELVTATRKWEPDEQRLRAEAFAKRMAGQQSEEIQDPTRDIFVRRDDISRKYTRLLKALLTEEQFAQLPGGYRWADLPVEEKPAAVEAMPTGDNASQNAARGSASRSRTSEKSGRDGGKPDSKGGG